MEEETRLVTPQPGPRQKWKWRQIPLHRDSLPAVWDLVMDDMRARDKTGAAKYGTRLQPHNGRDVLVDAYQEALDLCVYLRQAIFERDGR